MFLRVCLGDLGPIASSCVLTNQDNTKPQRTDFRCSEYKPFQSSVRGFSQELPSSAVAAPAVPTTSAAVATSSSSSASVAAASSFTAGLRAGNLTTSYLCLVVSVARVYWMSEREFARSEASIAGSLARQICDMGYCFRLERRGGL